MSHGSALRSACFSGRRVGLRTGSRANQPARSHLAVAAAAGAGRRPGARGDPAIAARHGHQRSCQRSCLWRSKLSAARAARAAAAAKPLAPVRHQAAAKPSQPTRLLGRVEAGPTAPAPAVAKLPVAITQTEQPARKGAQSSGPTVFTGLHETSIGVPRTLSEALAATYANQPILQAERAKLRATDENVPAALAGWRPTVQSAVRSVTATA